MAKTMKSQPFTSVTRSEEIDKTFHAKFITHQGIIRDLAHADKNSYAATVVQAMDHFTLGQLALKKLHETDITSCCHSRLMCETVTEFATSFRASELFSLFTKDLMASLKSIAYHLVESGAESTSKLDLDARVCLAVIKPKENTKGGMAFLNESRQKYTSEAFFQKLYCYLFTCTGQLVDGVKAVNEVIKLFPTHPDILYARAGLLRLALDSGKCPLIQLDSVKKAFSDYIAAAPKDHRFVPEAYYTLALLHLRAKSPLLNMPMETLQLAACNYQEGLLAEKNVLPCFLPFVSGAKQQVENSINIAPTTYLYPGARPGDPLPKPQWSMADSTVIDCRVAKDDSRVVKLIVAHRKKLKEYLSNCANNDSKSSDDDKMMVDNEDGSGSVNPNSDSSTTTTTTSEKKTGAQKKKKVCREIFLKDMIQSGIDQIYQSRQVTLTIVEDPFYNSSSRIIETICGDRNAEVINLQLCVATGDDEGQENSVKNLLKKFRFGSEWIMENPHFYINGDNGGQATIRVSDINSIGPARENQDKCRFCWKLLNPGQQCSKCRMVRYCGRDCQTQDWKRLKHSLICCEEYKKFLND